MSEVNRLHAKVTALGLLIEALWVDKLSDGHDPIGEAQKLVQRFSEVTGHLTEGDGADYAGAIREIVSSTLDRAATRALLLKQTGGPA